MSGASGGNVSYDRYYPSPYYGDDPDKPLWEVWCKGEVIGVIGGRFVDSEEWWRDVGDVFWAIKRAWPREVGGSPDDS